MFVGILAMSSLATKPNMILLYGGLESAAAGEIVSALEQRGVAFEVRGSAVFVDAKSRDELRLTLASEGLPSVGNKGYELLDTLSGFGTTSQMFDATYWRAKEGELARTIVSNSQINSARVHIAGTGANPFQRSVIPTASVVVSTRGGGISSGQAVAIRYLVASAVAGLSPENVAVIDSDGGMVGDESAESTASAGETRANILREKVERLLQAHVGQGNAIVEVTVDTVTDSETLTETRLDPTSRVAISTDTEERSNASSDSASGDVTVASNLPGNQETDGNDKSSSSSNETRERINYDFSETERKVLRASGGVKRISVAVLVNNQVSTDENGVQTSVERGEQEMTALRELIASAVGFDDARGDLITLKSMELRDIPVQGTVAGGSLMDSLQIDLMAVIKMAILALVVLILGLFLLRPLLMKQSSRDAGGAMPPLLAGQSTGDRAASSAGSDRSATEPTFFPSEIFEAEDVLPYDTNMVTGEQQKKLSSDNQVERLRGMIGEKQEETIEILRSWLEEKEESA